VNDKPPVGLRKQALLKIMALPADLRVRLMYLECLRRGLPFEGKEEVVESIKRRVAAKKAVRAAIEKAKRA
jgi:hypothetical protein